MARSGSRSEQQIHSWCRHLNNHPVPGDAARRQRGEHRSMHNALLVVVSVALIVIVVVRAVLLSHQSGVMTPIPQ